MTQPLSASLSSFPTLLPGPLATLMLAEAGAEGHQDRAAGGGHAHDAAAHDGEAAVFALLNRGKKSITLDLEERRADRNSLGPLL